MGNAAHKSADGNGIRTIAERERTGKSNDHQAANLVDIQHPERVMTVTRIDEIVQVNDMLRRGWRLMTLEMNGSEDEMGRLVSQSATFVLGHPEADAV